MSKNITEVGTDDWKTAVLDFEGPVLVDFWAAWCAPCRAQTPILEDFAAAHPDVKVVKVNVDEAGPVAAQYGIRSIPTIGVFKGGAQIAQAVGVQRAPQLEALVQRAR